MFDALANLTTAFGLSSSAGLNAYLPLLIVAMTARFTNLIVLEAPWDGLTNWWVIAVLAVLLVIEMTADKIPVVDHANDIIQTVVRPAAGAVLFAASSNVVGDIHPVLAMICGLLLAGTVHATKATVRPMVTASTAGVGNPIISLVEDIIAFVVSVLSIVLPLVAVAVLAMIAWWVWRRRRRRRQATMKQPST